LPRRGSAWRRGSVATSDNRVKLRTFEVVLSTLLAICMGLAIWGLNNVSELRRDVAVLQANGNGDEVNRRLDAIEKALTGYPPQWLQDKVKSTEAKVDELINSVNDIKVSLAAMKAKAGG